MIKKKVFFRSIVVVKKTFRYSNVFLYNHLYHPECYYEKRYKCPLGARNLSDKLNKRKILSV